MPAALKPATVHSYRDGYARPRGSLKGARERARTPSLALLHVTLASPPTSFPPPPQASERNEFPLATAKRCAACAVEADEYGCTAEAVHLYTLAVEWRMSVWKSAAQATRFGQFVLEHKR